MVGRRECGIKHTTDQQKQPERTYFLPANLNQMDVQEDVNHNASGTSPWPKGCFTGSENKTGRARERGEIHMASAGDEIGDIAQRYMSFSDRAEYLVDESINRANAAGNWPDLQKWHRVRLRMQRFARSAGPACPSPFSGDASAK
jgi:hypothetical protein